MTTPSSPTPPHRFTGQHDTSASPHDNSGTGTGPSGRPAQPKAPAAPAGDLTIAELAALMRTGVAVVRSRLVWASAAALVVVVMFGALIFKMRPEHTAVTTMLAQNSLDQIIRVGPDTHGNTQDEENSLRNHLSVMQSRRFSVMLAGEFSDAEMASIQGPYLPSGEAPSKASFEEMLSDKILVERERGREFFTIKFKHPDPDIAVLVVDRITTAYLKLVGNEFKQITIAASDILQQQANALKNDISTLEDQRRDYRLKEGIISVEENQGLLAERLKRLDIGLSDTRIQRVKLETQIAEARADLNRTPTPFENPILASYSNNALLRQALDQLNNQRDVLAQRYGPNHPKMIEVLLQINATMGTLRNNFDLAYRDLKAQLDASRTTENQLQSDFDKSFQASIEIDKKANRYLILGAEIEAKRTTLLELLNKVSKTGVITQLPSDIMKVVDPGYIDKPRLPKTLLVAVVGLFFALGAFVTVPFMLHAFDARLRGTNDIEKALGKDLLGCVPQLGRVRIEDRPHIVRNNVDLSHVEAFTSIASQVEFNSKHATPRVLLVTSTLPGEGKSLMVSNLASAFTKIGRKTVIID